MVHRTPRVYETIGEVRRGKRKNKAKSGSGVRCGLEAECGVDWKRREDCNKSEKEVGSTVKCRKDSEDEDGRRLHFIRVVLIKFVPDIISKTQRIKLREI